MPTIREIAQDPDFQALPDKEKIKALTEYEPDIAILSEAEKLKALNDLQFGPATKITGIGKPPPAWKQYLGQAADIGLPAVGTMGGGALGALASPAATPAAIPAGGALGYATGKQGARFLKELIGLRKDVRTPTQAMKQAALEDIPEGMIGEVLGLGSARLISLGKKKFNQIFQKVADPGLLQKDMARRMEIGQELGLDDVLTAADIKGTKAMSQLERQLQMSISTSDMAQQNAIKKITKFERIARMKQASKIGPPLAKLEAGQLWQQATNSRYGKFMAKAGQLYDNIPVKGDMLIETNQLADVAVGYIDDLGNLQNPAVRRILKVAQQSVDPQITIDPTSIVSATGQPFSGGRLPTYTWKKLLDDRSNLLKVWRSTGDHNKKRIISDLVTAIDDDIAAFSQGNNPKIREAFNKAKSFYHTGDEGLPGVNVWRDRRIANAIGSGKPERIVDDFIKPNNVSEVQRVVRASGEGGRKVIAQAWTEKMFRLGKEQSLSPTEFWSRWNKYDKATLRAFLKEDEYLGLSKIAEAGKMMNTAERLAGNPSGTAENVAPMLLAWNAIRHPVIMTSILVGGQKFGKLYYNNAEFKKQLIYGLRLNPNNVKTIEVAGKLAAIAGLDKIEMEQLEREFAKSEGLSMLMQGKQIDMESESIKQLRKAPAPEKLQRKIEPEQRRNRLQERFRDFRIAN